MLNKTDRENNNFKYFLLILRLFAKGTIKKNDKKLFKMNENINSICLLGIEPPKCSKNIIPIKLVGNELRDYLKDIFNIKDKLKSDIFLIEGISEKYYHLHLFKESKNYKIIKSETNIDLNKGNFLLIDNYNEAEGNIIFNKFTQVKILNEELLIRFSLKNYAYYDQLIIIKIISIEDGYYLALDHQKNIFKILIKENLKKYDIKLCKILIINDFNIIEDEQSKIKLLQLNENSIIDISSQDIYFAKRITLNYYSAIKIIFLDFAKNNNLYNNIEINDVKNNITKKEMYFVFSSFKLNNIDQYAITLQLSNDNGIESKIYYFILYHGLLNKINAFINFSSDDMFFIEYFYYHINKKLNNINKSIKINGAIYELNDFDTFQTENRQRINILNVPFTSIQDEHFDQNFFSSLQKNQRSFQICQLFSNKSNLLYGIFNIQEIFEKLVVLKENSDFDSYYDSYGNVENEIDDFNSFLSKYKKMFNDLKKNEPYLYKNIESLWNYESQITYSQYKTRLGLIICKYIVETDLIPLAKDLIINFKMIRLKIEEKKLSYFQKLRIYQFYFARNFYGINIVFFDELCTFNSPYVLANNFNKEEIKNINIYSRFFSAYLQFDSFILYNYIYKENSFSFSLELDFVMKNNLLSNYEEFIFTSSEDIDDLFSYETLNGKITVIHEKNLLGKSNVKFINDNNESKNIAFSISMENRHEKNCLIKIRQKNLGNTPILYCRDCKIKRIVSEKDPKKGKSGRIIESFIYDNQERISKLKTLNKYGSLLDYKYFIGASFDDLKKKVIEIDFQINEKGDSTQENKDEGEDENEDEDEDEEKEEKNNNEKGNLCEIFDKKKNKSKNTSGNTKNDLNSDSKESKETEVGKTYFIDDVEFIQFDEDNLGKHMNELEGLPHYFLKMKRVEDGPNN